MTKRHLRNAIPSIVVGMALLVTAPKTAGADPEGRWKLNDAGGCYFDLDDEGPNQCSPSSMPQPGRWKIDGNGGCVLDPNDSGPNQCTPTAGPQPGRWKIDGNGGCVFDSTDSGPNQCNPG